MNAMGMISFPFCTVAAQRRSIRLSERHVGYRCIITSFLPVNGFFSRMRLCTKLRETREALEVDSKTTTCLQRESHPRMYLKKARNTTNKPS